MAKSGQLLFEYVVDDGAARVTSFGGLPVVAETLSAFGVTDAIRSAAKPRTRRQFDYADIANALVLTGGGVLPCGRFGANAAWFRLSALTYNVLSVLRRMGPAELSTARPKRLRLHLSPSPPY